MCVLYECGEEKGSVLWVLWPPLRLPTHSTVTAAAVAAATKYITPSNEPLCKFTERIHITNSYLSVSSVSQILLYYFICISMISAVHFRPATIRIHLDRSTRHIHKNIFDGLCRTQIECRYPEIRVCQLFLSIFSSIFFLFFFSIFILNIIRASNPQKNGCFVVSTALLREY